MIDVGYAQVDKGLPWYFINNNIDLMNHDPKFLKYV